MRFEVLRAVKMLLLVFWVVTSYGLVLQVDTSVSEEHAASMFSPVTPYGLVGSLKVETVCSFETLVSTYKSTRRYNLND
jgi:hypothetical protein